MDRKEKKQFIKSLFPVTLDITQELLDSNVNMGVYLLCSYLPEEIKREDIFWGLSIGTVDGIDLITQKEIIHNGKKMYVSHYIDRLKIKEPCSVTFKIRE